MKNIRYEIIIDGDIWSTFKTQLKREKRKCMKRLVATHNYASNYFKSQLKEEDSNATNPIEFSDFSKVVLSSSTLLKLLKPSVYKC
jgi:hypothetical protein